MRARVVPWHALVVLGLTLSACAGPATAPRGYTALNAAAIAAVDPVPFDFAAFNAGIDAAVAHGETWVKDPLAVIARRFRNEGGEFSGEHSLWIRPADRRENPGALRAVLVAEGGGDDAISGLWASLDLVRAPDGGWRVTRDDRAQRCARGDDVTTWSGRPCP